MDGGNVSPPFFSCAPGLWRPLYTLSLGVRRGGRGWRSDILEGGRGEGIGCLSEPMMVEGGRGRRRTLLEGGKQAWQANEYIRGRRLLSLLDCLLACIARVRRHKISIVANKLVRKGSANSPIHHFPNYRGYGC